MPQWFTILQQTRGSHLQNASYDINDKILTTKGGYKWI